MNSRVLRCSMLAVFLVAIFGTYGANAQAMISLSPSSGPIGSFITVSGGPLIPNHAVTITIAGIRVSPSGYCTTTSNGLLSNCFFYVPNSLPTGYYPVIASDGTDNPTATFQVTSGVATTTSTTSTISTSATTTYRGGGCGHCYMMLPPEFFSKVVGTVALLITSMVTIIIVLFSFSIYLYLNNNISVF